MKSALSSVLLLSLYLAGCSSAPETEDKTACAPFQIPAVRIGSKFQFSAIGTPQSLEFDYPIVDWSILGGSRTGGGPLKLPAGSAITVDIGEPTSNLVQDGSFPQLIPVRFSSTLPDGSTLPFIEEWLDPADSSLQIFTYLNMGHRGDERVAHQSRFGRLGMPPLFGSSLFTEVPEGTLVVDGEDSGPGVTLASRQYEWKAAGFVLEAGECHFVATASIGKDSAHTIPREFEWRFNKTLPIPLNYRVLNGDDSTVLFNMSLQDALLGAGPELAPWKPHDSPAVGLPIGYPSSLLLVNADSTFHTPWDIAWERIRENPEANSWFEARPEARPSLAIHRNGSPDSEIVDEWTVNWWSKQGSATTIYREQAPSITDLFPLSGKTTFSASAEVLEPPLPGERLDLGALAAVHERLYGTSPETLYCDFSDGTCGMGTHRGTELAYAGQGASAPLIGIMVDATNGRIFQDHSLADLVLVE